MENYYSDQFDDQLEDQQAPSGPSLPRRFASVIARLAATLSMILCVFSAYVLWGIWPINWRHWAVPYDLVLGLVAWPALLWASKRLRTHTSGLLEWYTLLGFVALWFLSLARIFPQVLIK